MPGSCDRDASSQWRKHLWRFIEEVCDHGLDANSDDYRQVQRARQVTARAARRNVGFPYVIYSGACKTVFKKEKSDAIRIVDLRIAGGFRGTEKRWDGL